MAHNSYVVHTYTHTHIHIGPPQAIKLLYLNSFPGSYLQFSEFD